jgi:long-chain acyl-CoA synthetase
VTKNDVHLSYLPLAHMLERTVQCALISLGASIGFHTGKPAEIPSSLKTLAPTVFPSVPRVLNRIVDGIKAKVDGSILSWVAFHACFEYKRLLLGIGYTGWTWADYLAFDPIRSMFGGNLKAVLTGSAPIRPEVNI